MEILGARLEIGQEAVKNYYENLGKASGWFYSYVYVKDNILVQINGELPKQKAEQYQDALERL